MKTIGSESFFECVISVKIRVFNNKYTFTICVGRALFVLGYFILEKQTFNILLKVTGIQYIYYAGYPNQIRR